jgi:hypothetical protein
MSRRVSRLTLKGMFLITIAVGIISSSGFGVIAEEATVVAVLTDGVLIFALRCPRGGEPPEEEKSELLLGERERLSWEASSHCWVVGDGWDVRTSKMIRLTTGIELREGFFNCNWLTVRGVYWEGAEMGGEVWK